MKQPLRRFDEEKRRAIGEEIHKLMAAGFIKEVFHPEWLANPVLVRCPENTRSVVDSPSPAFAYRYPHTSLPDCPVTSARR